jgi:hypothetical protein
VLAERAYRAQEAQRATVRGPGDSGPGPRLGEIVSERLIQAGTNPDDAQWDSRKRPDGNWQVQLMFITGNRPQMAEWVFDPRRRHASPADDNAARLCLSGSDLPAGRLGTPEPATATVTPIGSRFAAHPGESRRDESRPGARAVPAAAGPAAAPPAPAAAAVPSRPTAPEQQPAAAREAREARDDREVPPQAEPAAAQAQGQRPARKAAGGRSRRASVPSWDEIMLGTSRQPD